MTEADELRAVKEAAAKWIRVAAVMGRGDEAVENFLIDLERMDRQRKRVRTAETERARTEAA